MPKLGVNVDHVATVRQARRTNEPDPVWAAALAQLGGADGITVHLREDRRHIQDRDVLVMKQTVTVKLNLECACQSEMINFAVDLVPDQVCLVPERREEVTTEGGLDVAGHRDSIAEATQRLQQKNIAVSLFIDPESAQISAAADTGANSIEFHTGQYALARGDERENQLGILKDAVVEARGAGLIVHAGHGLTYDNVSDVARVSGIEELNIGHSIVSRAVMVGFERAVREMKQLVQD